MPDEPNPPKFPAKKVDDLIASHGRKPSEEDRQKINKSIELERQKERIRQQRQSQKNEQSQRRSQGHQSE